MSFWTLNQVTLLGSGRNRLQSVSLEIGGGVTMIVGESGAGKSSLLGLLVGLDRPDSGEFSCHLRQIPGRIPCYWVPPGDGLWSPLTVREHLEIVSPPRQGSPARTNHLLTAFDLKELGQARPDDLSQGERARLAMARALASEAQVLVLDEPLVHTSVTRNQEYWRFVRETCETQQISLVIATHDLSVVRREANRIVILDQGRVVYSGDSRQDHAATLQGIAAEMLAQIQKAI